MSLLSRRRASDHTGQSLVEFALVLPIFLLLLFGVIDAGRYVYVNTAISNAAREGARLGSVEAPWKGSVDPSCGSVGGPICPATDAALIADITTAANRQMAPFGAVASVAISCVSSTGTPPSGAWSGSTCVTNASGGLMSMRVTYTWRALTPVIGNIMGVITSSASATVTIN